MKRLLLLTLLVAPPAAALTSYNLPCPSTAASIQAALDDVGASGGGEVVLAACNYSAANLAVSSNTDFRGVGPATKITAPPGSTGAVIKLKTSSEQRVVIRDLLIEGGGVAGINGIEIDNAGGATPLFNDFHNVVRGVATQNVGLDGFRLNSRGIVVEGCRAKNSGRDGFHLAVETTDALFADLHADASGRDGVHVEGGWNAVNAAKLGENTRHGLYLGPAARSNSLGQLVIDNTGWPGFVTGVPVRVEGQDNLLTGIAVSRGIGVAIELAASAARNLVTATAANYTHGAPSGLTHGVSTSPGSVANRVEMTVKEIAGTVAPGSDIDSNRVIVNGARFGEPLPIGHFRLIAGGPVETTSGGRLVVWHLNALNDAIASEPFVIPSEWRGRVVELTVSYNHYDTVPAGKNIALSVGLAGLAIGTFVTQVDVNAAQTVTAPAVWSSVQTFRFNLPGQLMTVGSGDVEGTLTIRRDLATSITGPIVIHRAWLRVVG